MTRYQIKGGTTVPLRTKDAITSRGPHVDMRTNLVRTLNQQEDSHLHATCLKMYMTAIGAHKVDTIFFNTIPNRCV